MHTRAYSISAKDIARERERVARDLEKIDDTKIIQLDELELPGLG